VAHLAALHPLVAPADADDATYEQANVAPFRVLLRVAGEGGIRRIALASSTSVWRESPPGRPARFIDETSVADARDGYARSKLACEELLDASGIGGVVVRLARFSLAGDPADEVRKLYRAIDPRDAADALLAALERGPAGTRYAIAAPTPFRAADAAMLDADPRAAIRLRTGRDPVWAPARIGSVIQSGRAERELGWRCVFPSTLLRDA
jgi:nucleoside-diphosphate-sugar epimerase